MRGFKTTSKMKFPSVPPYGWPSAEAGKQYIPAAIQWREKFESLYLEGKAYWGKAEFIEACNELFPEWQQEKWANSASQYAARLDSGASNALMRENAYRVLYDHQNGLYYMCDPVDGLNHDDFGESVLRAGEIALQKEKENLSKAHFLMSAEERQNAIEQYLKTGHDLVGLKFYAENDQLNLVEAAKLSRPNLGNGEQVKVLKDKKA